MSEAKLEDVREFWDANPCGSQLSREEDIDRYFEDHRRQRYTAEPHIPAVARWPDHAGEDVLEIGCGIGADGLEFAKAGARYTGVDLTPAAVATTKLRFERAGLTGRFQQVDAEHLPFPDASFDHVYSFGVIHHSPRTEAIVAEIHRVLRPGGTATVMVYNRTSINYKVEIMGVRKLFRYALIPSAAPRLISAVTGLDRAKLERHREIMVSGEEMTHDRWVSINTDGPDCPLARVYDEEEAARLFSAFEDVKQEVYFFDKRHWPGIGPRLPERTVDELGHRWGWHRVIRARKARA